MYGGIFEDFHRYMGTNIPQKQVFDIKVDINKDPEGYEKLRQMTVDFFNNGGTVAYYADDLEYDSEVFFDFVSKYTGYLDFLFAKSYEARKNIIEVLDRIDDTFVTPDKKRYVSKIANRNVIKVLDTNNNKIKELYLSCQEAWKIMYGENSLSSLERFFNIAFFRLLYRMAESHFYAEMDVNPHLAHLETIK